MAQKSSIWAWTKRMFFKGLATVLPTILTVYIFLFVFNFIRYNVSDPISIFAGKQLYASEWGRRYLFDRFDIPTQGQDGAPLEAETLTAELQEKLPWWPGFIIAFLAVLAVGFFIASWMGRYIWRGGEHLLTRIPMVKVIYPYAKQVTDFVFGDKKKVGYSSVVSVQYPRPGVWCIGFVTGEGLQEVKKHVGKKMLNVFLPCSPTPMSGFAIVVAEEETVPLKMTVDEAMRFIISAGVVVPDHQLTEEGKSRVIERTRILELQKLEEQKKLQE